ncbi:hypothetical protein FHS18_005678 [Paenibacillus phyllosphaerae]|uniref:DUF2140 family protein n=1 Tax=Paenibacillus phyllosphaerae TaxID=274593 RepID=A0A7W5B418_9BACL|nr:hypothetical protein [Paenibacillus phyllosphaerae]MBB3113566.1 hypothetical protein [Paenibacillus phyllosphaerae]
MRKGWKLAAAFIIFILAACGGLIWYIAPDEELNLAYEQVPLLERALDMVKRQSTELILTSGDLNNLAKRALTAHSDVSPDTQITGADFELVGDELFADVHVMYKKLIPAGVKVVYRFEWQDPNLIGTVVEAKVKSLPIPSERFERITIPLGEQLPKLIHVSDIAIQNGQLHIRFRKPKLSDLL